MLTNGTEIYVHDEFVAIGSVERHALDDAFSHVVLIPVLGFFTDLVVALFLAPSSHSITHGKASAVMGRIPSSSRTQVCLRSPRSHFGVHGFRFDGHRPPTGKGRFQSRSDDWRFVQLQSDGMTEETTLIGLGSHQVIFIPQFHGERMSLMPCLAAGRSDPARPRPPL